MEASHPETRSHSRPPLRIDLLTHVVDPIFVRHPEPFTGATIL